MDASGRDLTENRQTELRATNITIVALAVFFVGLRFFSRWSKGVKFGADDWTILLALVSWSSGTMTGLSLTRDSFRYSCSLC
jgi:hypothetical protein